MPGLRHGLAVQFEDQFRMARLLEVAVHILVAGHAGVGTNVEVSQIANAGMHAVLVAPIRARVPAEPALRRAMTTFTGNAFADSRCLTQLAVSHRVEWRMTDGAALVLRRITDSQDFGQAL